MLKITMKKGKLDVNGNSTYIYNFIDTESNLTQNEINKKFNYFGRVTKNGVKNQYDKNIMIDFLHEYAIWLKMNVGLELGKAQKAIDKCNKKSGCNKFCNNRTQENCYLLKNHNKLVSELSYIRGFLELENIEEVI